MTASPCFSEADIHHCCCHFSWPLNTNLVRADGRGQPYSFDVTYGWSRVIGHIANG